MSKVVEQVETPSYFKECMAISDKVLKEHEGNWSGVFECPRCKGEINVVLIDRKVNGTCKSKNCMAWGME